MSKSRLLVSVVLPTFRRPTYLRRAIESVFQQSYCAWELLIVDDNTPGSPARRETEDVVSPFLDSGRVRYLTHSRNKGGSAARNTGIQESRGGLVAFLDDDDEWLHEKLEKQVQLFGTMGEDEALVYTGFFRHDDRTGKRTASLPSHSGRILQTLLKWNAVGTTSTVLVRKSALLSVGGFDETLPSRQDLDLYVRIAQRFRIGCVREPLVILHRHQNPSIGKNYLDAVRARRLFMEKYRALIEADPEILYYRLKWDGKLLLDAGETLEARHALREALRLGGRDGQLFLFYLASYLNLPPFRHLFRMRRRIPLPWRN